MNPAAIPYEILYPNPINTEAKNAGIASSKSSQLILVNDDIIITPTIIKTGDVAADGTIPAIGAINIQAMNNNAVTTLVKPVRPPAPIPAALSTYVVVFDVPKIAPTDVAIASANKALSIFDLNPVLVSSAI